MSSASPPLPIAPNPKPRRGKKWKFVFVALALWAVLLLIGGYLIFRYIISTGVTRGPDNLFGDQHLKTTVALIELHKIRYGRYPNSLSDLRFKGQWDALALNSVSYYPNPDRTAYYIEVERGWLGKPDFQVPPEFWHGTGYSPQLKPASK